MDTELTRSLVQQLIAARAASDVEGIAALLSDDAVWRLPVSATFGPFEGRDVVAKALAGGVSGSLFDASTLRRDVHKIVVEGDTAVVQLRLTATTLQGREYVNEYCWVYTCRDNKIAVLTEYADTLHAARVFGMVES
jgi:ketosteroid isomerase-like protein